MSYGLNVPDLFRRARSRASAGAAHRQWSHRPQASACTGGVPISARKRDSAHVPYREADCFALRHSSLRHSYGGSGK